MNKREKNGLHYLQVRNWEPLAGLEHGFFTRTGGVSPAPYKTLNIGTFTGDDVTNIRENLRRIASVFSLFPGQIHASKQVHGTRILQVSATTKPCSVFNSRSPFQGDGIMTNQPGILLGILTADCLPVLFFDPAHPAVGAGHAGWRGTLQGISLQILGDMESAYGTPPERVRVALGPSIGPCCYTVGKEVALAFLHGDENLRPFVQEVNHRQWKLDLTGINRYQLLGRGVRNENIVSGSYCTHCLSDLFFSVREQGEPTGRQISLIGLT